MGIIVRERLHRFRTAVSVHCNAGSRILKKQTAMPTKDPQKKHPNSPYRQPMQEPPGSERDMSPKADHGEKSYKGNKKLEGRVALITGGDSGIGRAVAIAFAREGADLLISYLSEHEDAEDTANLVEKEGRRCITAAGDISEERQCIALVDQCVGELGRLDLLVNNAAHQRTKDDIQHFTSREFKYTFETNVYAMFYLCKAALPHLQPGSSIINVASIQAYQPSPNLLAYAATKGAIVTFTKALADMAIEKGVRVNAVAPGPIWTPLIPSTMPKEKVKQFGKNTPMGRAGQPAELAPAFVFLASQDSSYITGEVLGVTGGRPLP
jgi:NAD(P)-dependent dehydrogenase (short-subunit alcohol dehydrogenase family)